MGCMRKAGPMVPVSEGGGDLTRRCALCIGDANVWGPKAGCVLLGNYPKDAARGRPCSSAPWLHHL